MNDVPADVRRFLYEHIETLEELEAVVLLAKNPEAAFTVEEAEAKLHIPFTSLSSAFHSLVDAGLADATEKRGDPAYTLVRRNPLVRSRVATLASEYATNKFGIIKLLSEAAMDRVRNSMTKAFADAFILGGKKGRNG